jgi:dimethylargininase
MSAVDLSVAIQHHEALLQTLSSKCGLKIVHLPSDGYPDSVFIEDTLVVVGDQALITRPGAKVSHLIGFLI